MPREERPSAVAEGASRDPGEVVAWIRERASGRVLDAGAPPEVRAGLRAAPGVRLDSGDPLLFPDGAFDAVVAGETAPLGDTARVLRRGGALILVTPFGGAGLYPASAAERVAAIAPPLEIRFDEHLVAVVARRGGSASVREAVIAVQPALEIHALEREQEADALHGAIRLIEAARADQAQRFKRLAKEADSLRHARHVLEGERAGLRARVSKADGRLRAQQDRRWARLGEVLRDARRRPARLPLLPLRAAKVVFRKAPPRPAAGTRPSPSPEAAAQRRIAAAEAMIAEARYEEALSELGAVLADDARNLKALRRAREALLKVGDTAAALERVRAARRIADSEGLGRAERALAGRLRELDPAWLPEIPGEPEMLAPASGRRILHVHKHSLPYRTDGYTVRSRYTLLAQIDRGFDPLVVTSLGWPRTDGIDEFPRVERIDGVPHVRLDLGPGYPYKDAPSDEFLTAYAQAAAEIVNEVRPALLNVCSGFKGYEPALVGLALQRRFGIPMIYEVRGFLEHTWTAEIGRSERGELYRMRTEQEDRCMREAAHVITIAEVMRDEIIERGIPPERVTVIPNAVDPAGFMPKDPDPALVRELGLEGKTVLGYISNIGAREGIELLIEATGLLVRRGLPVACVVVGEGPERPRLEKMVADLGLDGVAHVVGPVPHERVRDYYSVIDVFVIPRRDDRAARLVTPMKPYEAMAMGKTMVVSALPALLEIVAPGERGLSFEVGSAEGLAAACESLHHDPALRSALGKEGRRWAVQERTWDANGRRYAEVYEEVLARFRATRG